MVIEGNKPVFSQFLKLSVGWASGWLVSLVDGRLG